jgi:hypothetical protein
MVGMSDEFAWPGPPPYLLLYSRGPWIGCLLAGCLAPLLIMAGLFMVIIITIVSPRDTGYLAGGALAFCGLVLVGVVTWGIVRLARPPAAWLEGTTVVVRGFFATRRCDLATATSITIDSVPEMRAVHYGSGATRSVPTGRTMLALRTQQSGSGDGLRVWLRHPNTRRLLEPAKLHALADAMLAGPRRDDPSTHQWIERIAQGLHEMADDPFADLR